MGAAEGTPDRARRLGQLIQRQRQEMDMTQRDLSERASVSLRTIGRVEVGEGPETKRSPLWAKLEIALNWPRGFMWDYLSGKVDETELAGNLRRDPVPEGDLTGMIRDVLFNVFGYAAPDVPLSAIRESERIALEVAKKHGYVPALRQPEASSDQSGEATDDA